MRDLKIWKQERRRAALVLVVRVILCSLFVEEGVKFLAGSFTGFLIGIFGGERGRRWVEFEWERVRTYVYGPPPSSSHDVSSLILTCLDLE